MDCSGEQLVATPLYTVESVAINNTVIYNGNFPTLFIGCGELCKQCNYSLTPSNITCNFECLPRNDSWLIWLLVALAVLVGGAISIFTFMYCFNQNSGNKEGLGGRLLESPIGNKAF